MVNNLITKYLVGLASTYGLPKVDSGLDFDILLARLEEYPRSQFVWLLYEKGSSLIPLNQGFDPNEAYAIMDNSQECICFHIQTTDFSINKISRVYLEELLFLPPLINPRTSVQTQVDTFIRDGFARQKWGLYATEKLDITSWECLRKFFFQQNVQPMLAYLREAERRLGLEQLKIKRTA